MKTSPTPTQEKLSSSPTSPTNEEREHEEDEKSPSPLAARNGKENELVLNATPKKRLKWTWTKAEYDLSLRPGSTEKRKMETITCTRCDKPISKGWFSSHIPRCKGKAPDRFVCQICKSHYAYKQNLGKHLKVKHLKGKPLPDWFLSIKSKSVDSICPFCDAQQRNIYRHFKTCIKFPK